MVARFGLEVTTRWPTIRTFGNWVLGLGELFIREPDADRYAMFQDDLQTYKNLRQYLESCPYPEGRDPKVGKGYWNLYTFPVRQQKPPVSTDGKQVDGWFLSNQLGRGAVALVFDREAVTTLLTHTHMILRPLNPDRGWRAIDGGIVSAMRKAGYREWVHHPSLVQHTGLKSTMGNKVHPTADSFRGEDYNAMEIGKVIQGPS